MLLVDNNLSPRLAIVLNNTYKGIVHVADVGLDEKDDLEIWEYASLNSLNILTKDADFNDILNMKGYPPKVIWIRSGKVTTKYLAELLTKQAPSIKAFLNDPSLGILEIM